VTCAYGQVVNDVGAAALPELVFPGLTCVDTALTENTFPEPGLPAPAFKVLAFPEPGPAMEVPLTDARFPCPAFPGCRVTRGCELPCAEPAEDPQL
jgi:hypothetical protein